MTRHEIWHGDCLELIPKITEPIHCLVTDPPYGMSFRSKRAVTPEGKKYATDIANDGDLETAIALFNDAMDLLMPKMVDECDAYVFTGWSVQMEWTQVIRDLSRHGFKHKMTLIWDRGWPGLGDIDANWGSGYEAIFYLKRGRRDVAYRRNAVIAVDKPRPGTQVHETEKPVPLLETLIEMSTDPGDLVVDPFSGSGSTILAAKNLGRSGIGMELDEKYVLASQGRLAQGVFV